MANRTRPKAAKRLGTSHKAGTPQKAGTPRKARSPSKRAGRKAPMPTVAAEIAAITTPIAAPRAAVATEVTTPLPLEAVSSARGACLRLSGNLSIHEAGACLAQVRSALDDGLTQIDVAGLETIDTAGVQLLLAAARAAHARGSRLRFSHADKLLSGAADALGLREALAAVAELPV